MLSKPWVWVVRIIWMVLFAGALWVSYWIVDGFIRDANTTIGALGLSLGWLGLVLFFYFGLFRFFVPEAYPKRLYEVQQDETNFQVTQPLTFVVLITALMFLSGLTLPFESAFTSNRPGSGSPVFAFLGGAFGILFLILIIRNWPVFVMLSIDDAGVYLKGFEGGNRIIAFGDISKIIVARRQVFRGYSLTIYGGVTVRHRRFFSLGRFKESRDDHLKIPRYFHPGFANEEILRRILAHCDDSVQVEYVRRISR